MIHLLENHNKATKSRGNLPEIFKQVRESCHLASDNDSDSYAKNLSSLIHGLEEVVVAISAIRNKSGDAHGEGKERIQIKESEARLVMNSATTLCEYLLS